MAFDIRPICPQDDTPLAAIIRQVLTEFGANRPGFAWSDPELDCLSQVYRQDRAIYYVVLQEQTLLGGAGIAPFPCEYPNLCELQKMYLLSPQRGQGIGRTLIDRLLRQAQAMGYRGCYLETLDTMSRAIQLYEKAGFTRLAKPLGDSGHSSCNRFYLRWFETGKTEHKLPG